MKFIDLPNPNRLAKEPDKINVIVSSGDFKEQGFKIKRIELRLYLEKHDKNLGPYSLITSLVETDQGSIEMIYDEGYRGSDSLERSAAFLINSLGISGLILRSVIALKELLEKRR